MTEHDAPRLVTISATYGAGGSIVAPLLAKKLELPFADRLTTPRQLPELPQYVSERATDDELAEAPRSTFLRGLALLSAEWNIPVPEDPSTLPAHVRARVLSSLEDLLESGGAVVLGRAAAIALGRRSGVYHVRLDGPVERRVERGAAWEGVDIAVARKHLEQTDAARVRYVKQLHRADPADPSLYHLVLDSTMLSIDDCVDLIAAAAHAAWSFSA
ncbi:MAG TPA: cytidylate kinase-like family protein [Acidimicrobiales bacterium]|nr:cytidylate kinase-like family protein [Acidimicrobiales bacterium]